MNKASKTVFLEIERLSSGSDGVGRVDGKVCFVPFTAPGDKVEARIVKENAKMIRAQLSKVVESGPARREPACSLVGACGGCAWQHVAYEEQILAKATFVERAIGLASATVVPSRPEYGYRRLARLHLRKEALGFKRYRGNAVENVERCPVLCDELNDLLPNLKESLLVPPGLELELRLVSGSDGPAVHIVSRDHLPEDLYAAAAGLSRRFVSVTLDAAGFFAHLKGDELIRVEGGDGRALLSRAGSFGQANATVNRSLCETVGGWLEELSGDSLVELYSGSGNLTVMIPEGFAKVVTGELDAAACEAAKKNLEMRGRSSVDVLCEDASTVYRRRGKDAEIVVLDPPRTGARELCEEIAAGRNLNVIYVSCDPGTLGRDVAILKNGGYKPVRAAGFDMFPQTAHLETAVHLTRD